MSVAIYAYTRSRLQKLARQLGHVPRTVRIVYAAGSRWTLAWMVLLVLEGVLPAATVYLTRALVDALVPMVRGGGSWSAAKPAVMWAALIGLVMLLAQALRSARSLVSAAQAERIADYVSSLVHRQSVAVDLAFYESPDCFDHLHRARAEGGYRPLATIETLGGMVQNAITLLAMVGVLLPFGPILPLALGLCTFPALAALLYSSRSRFEWSQRRTPMERSAAYYDWVLTSRECAAEVRAFELGAYFHRSYQQLREQLRRERLTLAGQQSLAELAAGVCGLLLTAGSLAYVVWRATLGLFSLGDLALFYQAFNQGLGVTRTLLDNLGRLYENSLFLGNLFEFLSLPSRISSPRTPEAAPAEIRQGLALERVSFHYPGTKDWALRDFNLHLEAGQIAAVVGPNGAGKSTLLKLIARLHDPDQGTICIDGLPLKALPLEELRRLIAVVFQAPVRFNATMAENIAFGDLRGCDEARICASVASAGIEELVARLPQGIHTRLGKQFLDGIELSAGEWQRVAIARALARTAPILLLDEPTSAMDPWAEIRWLENLRQSVRSRITLLVTHRFTTAMFADVIHVMAEGQIVESGTHKDLLRLGGLYAAGWAAQKAIEHNPRAQSSARVSEGALIKC